MEVGVEESTEWDESSRPLDLNIVEFIAIYMNSMYIQPRNGILEAICMMHFLNSWPLKLKHHSSSESEIEHETF